jgi:hypothetical protein
VFGAEDLVFCIGLDVVITNTAHRVGSLEIGDSDICH